MATVSDTTFVKNMLPAPPPAAMLQAWDIFSRRSHELIKCIHGWYHNENNITYISLEHLIVCKSLFTIHTYTYMFIGVVQHHGTSHVVSERLRDWNWKFPLAFVTQTKKYYISL